MKKLLAERHIGAILIAFLWAQAIGELIQLLIYPITIAVQRYQNSSASQSLGFEDMVTSISFRLLDLALYFGIGYFLAQWIYREKIQSAVEPVA
ncbi:MAG: hypothetical protein HYX26_07870 [Acidobacteriales bacterium]|nr:hypothetical protein [Terriglobales bacterium]